MSREWALPKELLLVPKVPSLNTAATYRIKDLKVSTVQAE